MAVSTATWIFHCCILCGDGKVLGLLWEGEGTVGTQGTVGPWQDTTSTCPNCHCHPNSTPGRFLHMPQHPFHSRDSQAGKLATSYAQRGHSPNSSQGGDIPATSRFLMCKPTWDSPQNPVSMQSSLLPNPITAVGEQRPTPKSHVNHIQPWTPCSQTPPLPWGS